VQLRIFGDDISSSASLAAQVKARMRAIPGTLDVTTTGATRSSR
jgi:Cu/Ag efflux pump CusA